MPRTDLLEQSAPRAEVDQRSRDARLRLENVERHLVDRPLPRQSLLKRLLRCLGSRIPRAGRIEGRSMSTGPTGGRTRRDREAPAEGGGVGYPAAPQAAGPTYAASARIGPARPQFRVWAYPCGRGDLRSRISLDHRF